MDAIKIISIIILLLITLVIIQTFQLIDIFNRVSSGYATAISPQSEIQSGRVTGGVTTQLPTQRGGC
jgi:cell division protein YceG involved in septum cleavage